MTRELAGRQISRISVIDDDTRSREGVELTIADADIETVAAIGPYGSIDDYLEQMATCADAAFCDHNLEKIASFSGAQAVARHIQRNEPAVLCTQYAKSDVDKIRPYRRYIPVLIRTDAADNPDTIIKAFEQCILELQGNPQEDRRPWRTLVRIERTEFETAYKVIHVVVPGWDPSEAIRLPLSMFALDVHPKLDAGTRFFAEVNLGATDQDDLFFDAFEI